VHRESRADHHILHSTDQSLDRGWRLKQKGGAPASRSTWVTIRTNHHGGGGKMWTGRRKKGRGTAHLRAVSLGPCQPHGNSFLLFAGGVMEGGGRSCLGGAGGGGGGWGGGGACCASVGETRVPTRFGPIFRLLSEGVLLWREEGEGMI